MKMEDKNVKRYWLYCVVRIDCLIFTYHKRNKKSKVLHFRVGAVSNTSFVGVPSI